jgi:uncharacterized protein
MLSTISERTADVANLCRRYGLARSDVFGSAARDDFDPSKSDIDFVVQFHERAKQDMYENFYGLREGLEALFGRPIDLLTTEQIKNPYLAASIDEDKWTVYAEKTSQAAE